MKNTIPKVSIIVPIHNAGNRLIRCIDTLVNQTLKEIEIILILDCPTDGSDQIARQFALKDERIIILENETNFHTGRSRSRGLMLAKGEYIGFSDHDDYRELTMYEELYNCAKKENSDIVLGISVSVGDQDEIMLFPPDLNAKDLQEYALIDLIKGGNDLTFTPISTNIHPNIYKTELIQKNNICFVDTLTCTPEDRIFQIMCLLNAKNVSLHTNHLYYHVIHKLSTGHTSNYTSSKTRACGRMKIFEFLKSTNNYEKYEMYFLEGTKKEFANLIINEFLITKNPFHFFKLMHTLKSFPFCKIAFRNTSYSLDKYHWYGKSAHKLVSFLMKI
ncbi:MAG TPA: glycosyltransferase [Paludibacter sp.]|nr:glycosyltransferase [Paludibacter sp.]